MQTLSIDLETYSDQPLAKTGVYRYVESPDFEILLFAYSLDGGSVQQIDLACGEKIPSEILSALEDETVTKWAFNANFERICLSRFLGYPAGDYLEPDSWKCSMVWAAYMGLPLCSGTKSGNKFPGGAPHFGTPAGTPHGNGGSPISGQENRLPCSCVPNISYISKDARNRGHQHAKHAYTRIRGFFGSRNTGGQYAGESH